MIWNHILHILFGFLGRNLLTFLKEGFLICFAITAVVQGIDTQCRLLKQKQLGNLLIYCGNIDRMDLISSIPKNIEKEKKMFEKESTLGTVCEFPEPCQL